MTNLIQAVTFSSVMATIGSVALAILILLVMVTVHEAGHYFAGKKLKFGVDEFSVGFGPAIFKRKNKRTGELFSVRAIPLGGYCMFSGEDADEEVKPSAQVAENATDAAAAAPANEISPKTPFNKMAPWKRIIVLAAGPLMNYLVALLCIIVMFFSCGQYEYKVYETAESEYSSSQSLVEGDIITAVGGKDVYLITDYISALNGLKAGDRVTVSVIRGDEEIDVKIVLRADADFKNLTDTSTLLSVLGVNSMGGVPVRFGFFSTLGRSFVYSFKAGGTVLQTLGELLTGKLDLSAMGGPVTTISVASEYVTQSFASFLEISATIGVNLAVFNLLPIPALDGSKIIFTVIEWIRRKPINRKVETVINAVGFVAILGFAVLVDILHFI